MIRAITMDVQAILFGPLGADFLSEVLRGEGISVEPVEVTEAMERFPAELKNLRLTMRTEEQENEYNRVMIPSLLTNLGVNHPTDALLMRLVETVHEYHAYFSMYPETLPVLEELKKRGLRMAVVANWEPSLGRLLREFELDGYFEAVVPSLTLGVAKPDPFIFQRTLKQIGVAAEDAVHIGPSLKEDVTGAMSAGMTPVWLNRTGISTGHEVLTITDLRGLLMLAQGPGAEQ